MDHILRLTLKKKYQRRYTITGLTSSLEYDPLQEAKFACNEQNSLHSPELVGYLKIRALIHKLTADML